MFAYCNNSPVNKVDPSGTASTISIGPDSLPDDLPLSDPLSGGAGYIVVMAGAATLVNSFSLGNALIRKLERSFASSANRDYRTINELHHIVPKASPYTALSRAIVNELIPYGVENPINKISINTRLHRHLHTLLYYGIVNSSIINAYVQGESIEEQQRNVIVTISILRGVISFIDKTIPSTGG